MKVFLDGPRDNSKWLDKIIPLLRCSYVEPKGDGFNPENQIKEKEECDIHLYVVSARQLHFHLIAQLIDSASESSVFCSNPKYVIYCLLYEDDGVGFSRRQIRSLNIVRDIFKKQSAGCIFCTSLEETANLINTLNN